MRASVIAALILSASTAFAAPLKTDSVDKKIASYDTPKNVHQDCDKHNVQCKAMNEDVYGTANYGSGAVGKQEGHLAHTGSQVAAMEGQSDLAKTLATDGPVIQHDLQGRDMGLPEHKEGFKQTEGKGNSDLSKTLMKDNSMIHHDVKQRDHGHSEYNEGLKQAGNEAYPSGLLGETGKFVQTQGEAAETAGKGLNVMGKEANGQTKTAQKGEKAHGGEVINSVIS
ncbi:uncharacterized protein IL334_001038 [Kwoniella shivajii]|uniref:Uncharacterized protein n=1 Tax=Kwoniella shivajii TaxID=564305 RepID=A0ABZ1CRX3_9TREE|nr:hypothetical protein IL334_001038 [Kwoniella shivajii]